MKNIMLSCFQRMVCSTSSDRANEKFVQWKEPMQLGGGTTNVDGDASTSRGRKKKWSTRGTVFRGAGDTTLEGPGVEDSNHIGSGIVVLAEGRGANSSHVVVEAPSTNPPPRFVPPLLIPITISLVLVVRENESERAFGQTPNIVTERGKCIQPPTEAVHCQDDSTILEGDGNFLQQNIPPPQGRAYI